MVNSQAKIYGYGIKVLQINYELVYGLLNCKWPSIDHINVYIAVFKFNPYIEKNWPYNDPA